MGHSDRKDPSNMLNRPVRVHTLNKFVSITHTHIGTPQLNMGHLVEKLTKEWDILTAKIPLICSTDQYEYTHTQQVCFNHTRTRRDPSTKDGTSCREADERMGHSDSNDPSNMLNRPVRVHTHSTSLFQSHTHT